MMDRWGTETLPLPGGYFRQTIKELMRDNKLYEGKLGIGGRQVDLAKITVPFLHVVAQHDHIVPLGMRAAAGAAGRLARQGGGRCCRAATSASWPGPNAVKRMWPKLDSWLERRST